MNRKILFCLLFLKNVAWGESGIGKDTLQVLPVNEDQVSALISSSRGKILLVNLWATWCKPCVDEFPHLVRLQKIYGEKGLKVLFISVDDVELIETTVLPFLQKQKVTFPTYIKNSEDDERFINAIGDEFRGAIPTTFVYDRRGKQVLTLVGAKDFRYFEEVIKPLLP